MGKPAQLGKSKIQHDGKIPSKGNDAPAKGPILAPGLADSKSYSKMKGSAGKSGSQKGV